jgi:hypothetical protein
MHELTATQRNKLRAHLTREFGAGTPPLAERIERAYRSAAWRRDAEEWLHTGAPAERAKFRNHYVRMSEMAHELIAVLDWEAPHGPMSSLTARSGFQISWAPLRELLVQLQREAEEETATWTGKRGRHTEKWRDELIRAVHAAYPQTTKSRAKKSRESHFERTIDLLLDWLGAKVSDTHGAVIRALRKVRKMGSL